MALACVELTQQVNVFNVSWVAIAVGLRYDLRVIVELAGCLVFQIKKELLNRVKFGNLLHRLIEIETFLLEAIALKRLLDQTYIRDKVRSQLGVDAAKGLNDLVDQILVELFLGLKDAKELVHYLCCVFAEGGTMDHLLQGLYSNLVQCRNLGMNKLP